MLPFDSSPNVANFITGLYLILGPEVLGFMVTYVDDLLIFSENPEQHIQHIKVLFVSIYQYLEGER